MEEPILVIEAPAAKLAIPPEKAEQEGCEYCDFIETFSEAAATSSGDNSKGRRFVVLFLPLPELLFY